MESIDVEAAAREIEVRLCRYLRIPVFRDNGPEGSSSRWPTKRARLMSAVEELERRAAAIGTIPFGYPRHIDLVMRVLSALLPWYTRNIVAFARQAVDTVRVLVDTLADLEREYQAVVPSCPSGQARADLLTDGRSATPPSGRASSGDPNRRGDLWRSIS